MSIARKKPVAAQHTARWYFHLYRMTKKVRIVVVSIVPATAMPYAAAKLVDEPNVTTANTTAINWSQFTKGIYTWPISIWEVWTTRMRGRNPIAIADWVTEYVAEMVACDAMTVAMVAIATKG